MKKIHMTLDKLRSAIDETDLELLTVLARRIHLVKEVGHFKKQHQIPPLDEARWKLVLSSRIAKGKSLGIDVRFVEKIFATIHEHALELEKQEGEE